jgi:hypothetical protein
LRARIIAQDRPDSAIRAEKIPEIAKLAVAGRFSFILKGFEPFRVVKQRISPRFRLDCNRARGNEAPRKATGGSPGLPARLTARCKIISKMLLM